MEAIRDQNRIPVALGVSNTDATVTLPFKIDSTTGRILISSAGLSAEVPVGTVNGSNTAFTVSNTPLFVVIDGMFRVSGNGYTYAAPTITTDALTPPTQYIVSYYNA